MNRFRAFALIVTFLSPSVAFAGGWTQEEGKSYAKVWGTGIFGSQAFDLDGEIVPTDKFSLVSLGAYGEYGLRRDLTLLAALQPIGVAHYADRTSAYAGPMMVGFRQRFAEDPLQFALEVRLGGSPGWGGEVDMAAAEPDLEFRPSVRSYFAEWALQVGVPIGTVGWATASVGPRWASDDALDSALQGSAQVGFGPFGGFLIDAHLSLNHTFKAPELVNIAGAGNTRYIGVGLGLSWWLTDSFAISAAADGVAYAASNAATPALQLGVEFRR